MNNPIGYTAAFSLEYIAMLFMAHFAVSAISLALGCFLLSFSLIKDIKDGLDTLNKDAKSNRSGRSNMLKKIADIMNVWSNGKQLSKYFFFLVNKDSHHNLFIS